MPFPHLQTGLNMASVVMRRLGFLGSMSSPVAGRAGRRDIIGMIQPSFAPGGQVFSRTFKGPRQSFGQPIVTGEFIGIVVPHGQIAITAAPILAACGYELEGF